MILRLGFSALLLAAFAHRQLLVQNAQSPSTLSAAWYLSGRVVLDDGMVPAEHVTIESVCNGVPYVAALTDSQGQFSFRVGAVNNRASQDASVGRMDPAFGAFGVQVGSGSGMPGANANSNPATTQDSTATSQQQSGSTDSQSQQAIGLGPSARAAQSERALANCELEAKLPGYRTEVISLAGRKPMDGFGIGTIILYRLGRVAGRTVSVTTLATPKSARREYEKGRKAAGGNRLEEARKELEKAVQMYPQYAAAWTELGEVQVKQGQPENAARAFDAAIQADPKYMEPYLGLALLQASEKQWRPLVETAGQALRLDPVDYPQAYYLDALANFNIQQLDAAEKSAREAERLDDQRRFPESWRILGLILAARHQFAEAAGQLREYLKMAPRAADASDARAELAQVEKLATSAK